MKYLFYIFVVIISSIGVTIEQLQVKILRLSPVTPFGKPKEGSINSPGRSSGRGFFYIPTLSAPCSTWNKSKTKYKKSVERTGIDRLESGEPKSKLSVSNEKNLNSRPHNASRFGMKTLEQKCIQLPKERLRASLVNSNIDFSSMRDIGLLYT